jgi:hypothetical protein
MLFMGTKPQDDSREPADPQESEVSEALAQKNSKTGVS